MKVSSAITGVEALERWRAEGLRAISPQSVKLTVGMATCGLASGAQAVFDALAEALGEASTDVIVASTGCLGFCEIEPIIEVWRPGRPRVLYGQMTAKKARELAAAVLDGGEKREWALCTMDGYPEPGPAATIKGIPPLEDLPFYSKQKKITLARCGRIDPESLSEYVATGGYSALCRALSDMTGGEIIAQIERSGLRGRGGAGFPTGKKWRLAREAAGDPKYVVCNADEGDPGAYMDRSLLEGDPFAILEGMTLGAYAIGAREGFIYVRDEYPLAIDKLEKAVSQARMHGLLGERIMGSGFSFDVRLIRGGGAFVCGEETALIASIEGRPGEPRQRPPFPVEKGLWGKPTNINNVETWATVPWILSHGADAYREVGTETSRGTKVFSVVGKINNSGLIEVPTGITLGEIVYDIGGGIRGGKRFKAVQTGGPSGACIPGELLNLPVDYESLTQAGAIMGSGGMIVMDEDTCMVDVARFFLDFLKEESCGKCAPCREGIERALEILEWICQGEGKEEHIEMLEAIGKMMKGFALCALGTTAANPLLSTIRYFRDEYEAHIRDKRCPAGVCTALFESPCQNACPVGTDVPAYIALVRAGRVDDAYEVLKRTNPFPSVCGRVCGNPCQYKCRRAQLDEPLGIRNLKRFVADNAKHPKVEPIPVTRPERIAVIGAGPAGLTAALELKKRGYAVTVFEMLPEPGGMLRWGIPAYRLPRDVLSREIQEILDTGVELHTNTKVGRDISFQALHQGFEVIYLGVGAQKSTPLNIPNEGTTSVFGAVEFLRAYNSGQAVSVGERVAVIGGGNSAIDAARTSIRLGAESVTIFYRRERKDMPAQETEIEAAEEEGVEIEYLTAPLRVIVGNKKVSGLELVRMRLRLFEESGRKRPESVPNSQYTVEVDTVISAIGHSAELDFLPKDSGIETTRATIKVDGTFRTANAKVWAGGDVVTTGLPTVIDAIAAGQQAARAIDKSLRKAKGETPWTPAYRQIDVPCEIDEEIAEQPQALMPEEKPQDRRKDFREVELGYTLEMAMAEARRCLRCDAKPKG